MTDIIANAPDEEPPSQPGANSGLRIPGWVPPAVGALARTLYADAIVKPPDMFGALAEAIVRLTTDPRMRKVWTELGRRSGGADRNYLHPAQECAVVAWPGFEDIRDLAQHATGYDRLQEQAAALLFMIATGFFPEDRLFDFGPRTRTQAEIEPESQAIRDLAREVRKCREGLRAFGHWQYLAAFEEAANALDAQVQMRCSDPFIVERRSGRLGDDWMRGFIIHMAMTCRALFGDYMLGTVATLGNVAYARSDLTIGKVRGVLRAPNKGALSR